MKKGGSLWDRGKHAKALVEVQVQNEYSTGTVRLSM